MTQQYFTDSEWATLVQAPSQAITAILLADKTDLVSFLKEVKAAVQILSEEKQRQDLSSDLVTSLLGSLKELDAAETLQGEELLLKKQFELLGQIQSFKDAAEGRKKAIAHLGQVSGILATKVTALQATEFKNWLFSITRKVAEAVKEEGFLGIGGERISGSEQSVLRELERALEVKV